ncbi:MAG: sulfatase-like hydrolase/transferase [Pricia sp.]
MKTGRLSFLVVYVSLLFGAYGQEKPNVLWITIEDTSPQFIGCYGNPDAKTPVIDQLAKEGIRFTNAFSTGTVCSPSRSAIITGVPTFKLGTGHHRSQVSVPEFIKGFPYFLKKAGYYTSNNFKTDYNIANEKQFVEEAWNESSDSAGWWNKEADQAFFSVFNFPESHQSRTMSWPFEQYEKEVWNQLPENTRIPDDAFEMPPIYKDSPEMRKQMARVYNSIALTDIRIGQLLQRLEEDGLRDDTIIFFYADHGEGMPRGKTNGIDYGYRVPFIIWFPEKYKQLNPWRDSNGTVEELVNFENLAPTVLSLADAQVPDYYRGRAIQGEQRKPAAEYLLLSSDRADNGPDLVRTITDGRYVYSRNYMPFLPQLRYIRYLEISDIVKQIRSDHKNGSLDSLQNSLLTQRPPEFLFDIQTDQWETENLIDSPGHQSILKAMRKQLQVELQKAKDVHFLPEYELAEIQKTTTPYEFRQEASLYPFNVVYAAASLSGKRDASTLKEQLRLLKNKNKIVRYWAITGLKSHSKEHIHPIKNQLEKAMSDSYAPVAILASAILYDCFDDKEAERRLKQYAESDNMHLALLALNTILYFKEKSPFLETIREVRELPDRNYNVKAACMDFLGIMGLTPNLAEN